MPGFLYHVSATAICPHCGQVSVVPSQTRALVSNQIVATISDFFPIAGCPFTIGTTPSPCVRVQWLVPASRVLASGKPVILQSSSGLCPNAAQGPQGPPNILVTQTRVKGI